MSDKLLDVMAAQPKIVPYLDLPIQHCSERVLKAMNRQGGREAVLKAIERIRTKLPHAAVRTTLIVGFPGETQAEFEELCHFVKQKRFDRLGCFAYSEEEGTPAASLPDKVPEEEKLRRQEIVMREQAAIMEQLNEQKVGTVQQVIVEGYDPYIKHCFGRTAYDAPEVDGKIFFTAKQRPKAGDFVAVEVTDVLDYDLLGRLQEAEE